MRPIPAFPSQTLASQNSWHRYAFKVLAVLAASVIVALAARISFPLPFTPVPFSLQPLAVLCVGLWLGPRLGAAAMVTYLAEGAAGIPVFAPTGPGGLVQLFGATGGFLLAYPAVAFVAGGLALRLRESFQAFTAALLACTAATMVLFAGGAAWLALCTHLGFRSVLVAAVLPFLPGEAVKIFAAAGAYRALTSKFKTV